MREENDRLRLENKTTRKLSEQRELQLDERESELDASRKRVRVLERETTDKEEELINLR